MKRNRLLFILFILITILILNGCNSGIPNNSIVNEEDEKIRQAALDYIEGWYEGNENRMQKALHPDMVKRRFEGDILKELDRKRMVSSTKSGGGKNIPKDTFEIEVEILDISNNIASVVTKSQYVDYLHLAKVNNEWVIINVLWDFNKE